MKGIVYILQSTNTGHYYVGSTTDINRRVKQHQRGHTSTTKRFGNFRIVFTQSYETITQARAIERKIKSWKRKDFIEKIIADGFINSKL